MAQPLGREDHRIVVKLLEILHRLLAWSRRQGVGFVRGHHPVPQLNGKDCFPTEFVGPISKPRLPAVRFSLAGKSGGLRLADRFIRSLSWQLPYKPSPSTSPAKCGLSS